MNTYNIQEPCVVETPQGFSVSYNNQLLYSKYNPKKLILNTIENLQVLPGSVILCNSPVLGYGLNELVNKLPENCLIILCEAEPSLYSFSLNHISLASENILFPSPAELYNLPITLFKLSSTGKYRRVLNIDFSAGATFHKDLYVQLYQSCTSAIMTFWKNRVTLTKFGRKYSHNFFQNLHILPETKPINNYFNSINKPILVFGAGQSIDIFFSNNSINSKDFYILCADTAMQPLLSRNIYPDGVFIEEAQTVISKAFIGIKNTTQVFAGLSSLPSIKRYVKPENISFFATLYTQSSFLNEITKLPILPPTNEPFGSVGLTTVYYALKFRRDSSIPVYVCGLDFSYSAGITHGKETIAHKERLIQTNRLKPVQNYAAAFNLNAIKITDKKNNSFITSPTLQSYGQLFNTLFNGMQNLYDVSECGFPLDIPDTKISKSTSTSENQIKNIKFSHEQVNELTAYLLQQKQELIKLKNILTGEIKLSPEEQKDFIIKTATSKEYLYLHFADGYCFNYNQSFLNRIRTEIDFFLKFF